MLKQLMLCCATVLFAANLMAANNPASDNPKVLMTTSLGAVELELNADKAPISVNNFMAYVDSGFYKNTQFHRVIPGFMVQGGGFDSQLKQKQNLAPIKNEADNGLHNVRGSIAMARTQIVNSATSQFFINHQDNAFLDHGSRDFGYAVFGKVTQGMDIVDKIAQVPTHTQNGMPNVPQQPVLILDIKRI